MVSEKAKNSSQRRFALRPESERSTALRRAEGSGGGCGGGGLLVRPEMPFVPRESDSGGLECHHPCLLPREIEGKMAGGLHRLAVG